MGVNFDRKHTVKFYDWVNLIRNQPLFLIVRNPWSCFELCQAWETMEADVGKCLKDFILTTFAVRTGRLFTSAVRTCFAGTKGKNPKVSKGFCCSWKNGGAGAATGTTTTTTTTRRRRRRDQIHVFQSLLDYLTIAWIHGRCCALLDFQEVLDKQCVFPGDGNQWHEL